MSPWPKSHVKLEASKPNNEIITGPFKVYNATDCSTGRTTVTITSLSLTSPEPRYLYSFSYSGNFTGCLFYSAECVQGSCASKHFYTAFSGMWPSEHPHIRRQVFEFSFFLVWILLVWTFRSRFLGGYTS